MNLLITILYFTKQHLLLVACSTLLGILSGIPLALSCYFLVQNRTFLLTFIEKTTIISPWALLFILQPLLGFSFWSTLILLVYFNTAPIAYYTLQGLHHTNADIILSSKCLGLSRWTQIMKVQLPLVLPQIILGIRRAMLHAITIVTITSYFSQGGGLGYLLLQGVKLNHAALLYGSAMMLILMALCIDSLFILVEKKAANIFSVQRFRNALPLLFFFLIVILAMYWLTTYYADLALLKKSISGFTT